MNELKSRTPQMANRRVAVLKSSSQKVYDQLARRRRISPRVANAARLYMTGAVRTKAEAARAVGLKPITFYAATMPSGGSEIVKNMMSETSAAIQERAIDVGALLQRLSVEALTTIDHVRKQGSSEALRLKAAIDLADRGPQTSKIQRHQVESFTLAGRDVEAIRQAMLEGKEVAALNEAVSGDFEEVPLIPTT